MEKQTSRGSYVTILVKYTKNCGALLRVRKKGETGQDPPSAKGTTIKALSTKTVLVRCWETPTDSGSRNFTKQTREVTGKGESLEKNTDMLCKKYKQGATLCLLYSELDWSWTPGKTQMWIRKKPTLEKWQQSRLKNKETMCFHFGSLEITFGYLLHWLPDRIGGVGLMQVY